MRHTWEDFENDLIEKHPSYKHDIEVIDAYVNIVTAIIKKRDELGLSQRDLARICELPQSSVARIESFTVTPNIDTLLKIMLPLGLTLTVASV